MLPKLLINIIVGGELRRQTEHITGVWQSVRKSSNVTAVRSQREEIDFAILFQFRQLIRSRILLTTNPSGGLKQTVKMMTHAVSPAPLSKTHKFAADEELTFNQRNRLKWCEGNGEGVRGGE